MRVLIVGLAVFSLMLGACAPATQPSAPQAAAPTAAPAAAQPTEKPAATATAAPAVTEKLAATATQPAATATQAPTATEKPAPTATSTRASAAGQTTTVSFAKDVLPILQQSCIKCHGGEKTEADLSLKDYAGVMAGSENGPVVIPGNAAESDFVRLVAEGKMPKRANRLPEAQVKILTDWVNAGAPNN